MSNIERGEREPLSSKEQLVQSGIAQRMLDSIIKYQGKNEVIDFGVEDCDFKVEKEEDERTGRVEISVKIEMPQTNPLNKEKQARVSTSFGLNEKKRTLGANQEPLSDEQFLLIMELAGNQEQDKAE